MTFDTNEYELTHGRKPRGEGSWAFQFFFTHNVVVMGTNGRDVLEFAPGLLTYSAAKRWAIARAKELGACRVAVAT